LKFIKKQFKELFIVNDQIIFVIINLLWVLVSGELIRLVK
jgi:hypothetical protein